MKVVFPLKVRRLIRGFQDHINAGLKGAADYEAHYVDLLSPVNGVVLLFGDDNNTGGFWIRVTDEKGRRWEHAHLSQRLVKTGDTVRAGQKIGVTGNTGTVTTGPHLHQQIIAPDGVTRLDPEQIYAQELEPMPPSYNDKIVRDQENGAFALVVRGKKYVFDKNNKDVLALITFMQRIQPSPNLFDNNIINISHAEFEAIPLSNGLDF